MAVIIEKASGGKKGILLLSHRELSFFKLAMQLDSEIREYLLAQYKFILHIGFFHKTYVCPEWVSFVLTSPSNVQQSVGFEGKLVPVSSRDVLPECFLGPSEQLRKFDCIYICNNSRNKRGREYLEFCKKYPDIQAAFVLTTVSKKQSEHFDTALVDDAKDFARQSDAFHFFDASVNQDGTFVYRREEIASMLRQSKVYIHFCRREGESRSMGEAMASGCEIIIHQDLEGGGVDLDKVSKLYRFRSQEILYQHLREILQSDRNHQEIRKAFLIHRDKSFVMLREALNHLGCSSEVLEGLFRQDLSMLLPGHIREGFAKHRKENNSDVTDPQTYMNLINVFGMQLGIFKKLKLKILFFIFRFAQNIRRQSYIFKKKFTFGSME